jgi:putative transcriptional regulator
MKAKKPSELVQAMLETAADLHRTGLMDDAAYERITLPYLKARPSPAATPIAPAEIRALRESARMSQAAFARYLNLTTGYISQLERGTKQPKGPALALLNVMRRKGVDIIL